MKELNMADPAIAQEDSKLLDPSAAYAEAIDSPVYRLSELMFGSLLAAYVLGFVGFSATVGHSRATTLSSLLHDELVANLQYLFISMTYAYSTAGFYMSYHAGLLTMPTLPLQRLRWDFMLALAQAVTFGYSMRYGKAFPVLLGLIFLWAVIRQSVEHRRLRNRLYKLYGQTGELGDGREDDPERETKRAFNQKLVTLLRSEAYCELSDWSPVRFWMVVSTLLLMAASVGFWYLESLWRFPEKDLLAAETLAVALIVFFQTHGVLRRQAKFLTDRKQKTIKMDKQFQDLEKALKEYAKSN